MRAVLIMVAACAFSQERATIHVTVRDASTGTPMAGVLVNAAGIAARTDAQGGVTLRDVPAGSVRITASGDMVRSLGAKAVKAGSGQDLTVEMRVQALGRVFGTVFDEDGKPVPDANVTAVTREYRLGRLRYVPWYGTLSNDRGAFPGDVLQLPMVVKANSESAVRGMAQGASDRARYAEVHVATGPGLALDAGRAYLLLATKGRANPAKDGELDDDPAKRKPVPQAVWYIDAKSAEGALPLTLAPGERREGLNIRMPNGPNYCIHGRVRAGALPGGRLDLTVANAPVASMGLLGIMTIEKRLAVEGETTVHICNLTAGDYRISSSIAASASEPVQTFLAQEVTISDRDVSVTLDGAPPVRLTGEVVWDDDAAEGLKTLVALRLDPAVDSIVPAASLGTRVSVPERWAFERVFASEYELSVDGIPDGAYLKDVIDAGHSLMHRPIPVGATGELRVVLGRNGGRIAAQVMDGEGRPVDDRWIAAFPAGIASPAALADWMVAGAVSGGRWRSPMVAPGKYLVVASPVPVDHSMESVDRLWNARGTAQEVEVGPGATATVRLQ